MARTINQKLLSENRPAAEPAAPARTASAVADLADVADVGDMANGTAATAATVGVATTATTATTDVADVHHAAAGDLAAFERLYRRHSARIHSLARRMLGTEEADEATQDAFVRAWEKLGTFRGEAAFSTWLHRLAVNLFLGMRTREARLRDRFQEDTTAIESARCSRSAHADQRLYLRLELERAIEELPEGARQVFTLYDIEGYRHEEISNLLEITVGTSKSQLHRARMLLRAHLT